MEVAAKHRRSFHGPSCMASHLRTRASAPAHPRTSTLAPPHNAPSHPPVYFPFLPRSLLVLLKSASDVVGKLAVFGVLALAARALPLETFAWLSIGQTFGWMLSVATDFGLQMHLAREVARDPAHAGRAVWPLLTRRLQLFAGGLAVALVTAFVWLPSPLALAFAGVAVGYLLSSIVEFLNYAFRALNRSDIESMLNAAQRLATLAMAWALLRVAPSFASVALAMVVPPIVAGLVSVAMLSRMAPRDAAMPAPLPWAPLIRRVAPIGIGVLLSALYFRVDIFLLQRWAPAEDVAQYGAVFRLIDALRLFPAALLAVALPAMFRGRDTRFLIKLSVGLTVFGMVASVVLDRAAPFIVPLAFGDAYVPAVSLFRILLIAFPLLALNYGLTTQLIGWNGQSAFAVINATGLIANVAMNLYLIPRIGAAGAAWSTVGTELLLTFACGLALPIYAQRELK